jgi:hypothetical protein
MNARRAWNRSWSAFLVVALVAVSLLAAALRQPASPLPHTVVADLCTGTQGPC